MSNWKSVPIPEKMKLLEKDSRGYPISFTTIRNPKGQPNLSLNDEDKVIRAFRERRCAICGTKLDDDIWIIGGPLPAFHPSGAYLDPPNHHECGTYALQVCPYLSAPSFLKKRHEEGIKGKPPFFVFAKISDYKFLPVPSTKIYMTPVKPFQELEYWLGTNKITREEAEDLFKNDPIIKQHFNAGKGTAIPFLPEPGPAK